MGNSESGNAESPTDARRQSNTVEDRSLSAAALEAAANEAYACIHFRGVNEVYVLCGNLAVRTVCQEQLDQHVGVSKTKEIASTMFYIQLNGCPFHQSGLDPGVAKKLRLAAAEVLRELYVRGWILVTASNLTRTNTVTSWFFKNTPSTELDPTTVLAREKRSFLIFNISSDDKIQLFNAPKELQDAVTAVISQHYAHGIAGVDNNSVNCRTIQLSGRPWALAGELKAQAVLLVARIMAGIESGGYTFYGTADFKGNSDCMFFAPTTMGNFDFSNYAVLTLENEAELRFANIDKLIAEQIGEAINTKWSKGTQHSGQAGVQYDWKMRGRPWWSSGKEAIESRLLIAKVFDIMSAHHYEHYATLDLSRRLTDKSSVIFRLNPGKPRIVHAVVSPSSCDKLRLIGFSNDSVLRTSIPRIVQKIWQQGVQGVKHGENYTELKLRGTPFDNMYTWKTENYARIFMIAILAEMNAEGYQLVSSCDVSAKFHAGKDFSFPTDLDSWIVGKPITEKTTGYKQTRGSLSYKETLCDYPELL